MPLSVANSATAGNMEYHENTKQYYAHYVRNSRAVGVMWGIFTICFAIIAIVVFIQPQWIGDTEDSIGTGYFGLWKYCELYNGGDNYKCGGEFDAFSTILNGYFKAASVLVGLSALIGLVCICALLLFFLMSASQAYLICGWIQIVAGLCMMIGCIVYPAGWDHDRVRSVCGSDAGSFKLDECGVRWAYILAIIAVFDAFILSILAFVLATRQAKWSDLGAGTISKSDLNGYLAETESKPSIAIQPVLTVPPDNVHGSDRFSEYSHASTAKRSRKGDFAL